MKNPAGFNHKLMLIILFATLAAGMFAQVGSGLIPFHRQEVQTALATGDIASLQEQIYQNLQHRGGWVTSWTHVYDRATVVYWNNYETHEYQYQGNHPAQLTQIIVTSNTSGSWQNYQRMIPAYVNGWDFWRYSTYTIQNWTNNNWGNYYRTIYTYNADDSYNTIAGQMWGTGTWQNYSLTTYYYAGNRIDYIVSQTWNSTGWVNSVKTEYFYDAQNRISQMVFYYWSSNGWVLSSRMVYTYTPQGDYQFITTQVWNAPDGEYVNSSHATYYYNAYGQQELIVYEAWQDYGWVSNSRIHYFYDGSGNNTESIHQNYNSGWVDYSRRVMQYEFWDVANQDDYVVARPLQIELYPNPARNLATLLINSSKAGAGKAEIYNLKGEKCALQEFSAETGKALTLNLDTSLLPSGVYLVRTSLAGQQQTIRMLKLK